MDLRELWRMIVEFIAPPSEVSRSSSADEIEEALELSRTSYLDIRAKADPLHRTWETLIRRRESLWREHSDLTERARDLLDAGSSESAEELMIEQQRLEPRIHQVEQDLEDLEGPLARVRESLRQLEEEMQELERDRDRARALEAGAQARVALTHRLAEEADFEEERGRAATRALEGLEDSLQQARTLEALESDTVEARLEAIADPRSEARRRLEALRRPALPSSPDADESDGP